MRTRPLLVAPLLGGILALALVGCSVALTEPDTAPPARPSAPADTSHTAEEEPPAAGDSPGAARDDAVRTAVRDRSATTLTCDGELVLDGSHTGESIVIDGSCETLAVHGDIMEILAGDIGTLLVTGDGNLILTDTITTANVSGDINEIYWGGDTPKSTNGGAGNVLKAG